jgi:negative modulator of initiation of replication
MYNLGCDFNQILFKGVLNMKYIEIDDELYKFIASKTERIGESASDILRRLIYGSSKPTQEQKPQTISQPSADQSPKAHEIISAKSVKKPIKLSVTPLDSLLKDQNLSKQKGAVGKFLYLLERLENIQGAAFKNVLNIQGRGRLYFATSKSELIRASKTSNPKEIGTTGYWVITNNNTAKKRTILHDVLCQSGLPKDKAEQIAQLI